MLNAYGGCRPSAVNWLVATTVAGVDVPESRTSSTVITASGGSAIRSRMPTVPLTLPLKAGVADGVGVAVTGAWVAVAGAAVLVAGAWVVVAGAAVLVAGAWVVVAGAATTISTINPSNVAPLSACITQLP